MSNLASGVLPPEVVADIGKKMQSLKQEMGALELTPPPHDFTADQIKAWLNALKNETDDSVKASSQFRCTPHMN